MAEYVILFMIYSTLGWICEIATIYIEKKKIVNRGFLIGPYLPIFGCGCLLITLLLSSYANEPFALFALSMIICAILEYFTGWIMEVIFKMRWWDYSNNKFNINGRICLETLIPFGLAGIIVVRYLNPLFLGFINLFPSIVVSISAAILGIIFIIDCAISLNVITNFKSITKNSKEDSTEEIKKYVSEVVLKNKYLYNRLIKAFPKLTRVIKESRERGEKFIKEQKQKRKKNDR